MMKKNVLSLMISFLCLVFAQNSIANESFITVSCALPEIENVHRFQAFGVIKLINENEVSGTLTLQLIKGTEVRSVMQFDQIAVQGKIESFEVSELNPTAYQLITLSTDIPYVDLIELYFSDIPLASKVKSIDNFSYRSGCKFYY